MTIDPSADFVAIDFETADYQRDSACSVAMVHVSGDEIVDRVHRLIRPPRSDFKNSHIHGIHWWQVRDQPTFLDVWTELAPFAAKGSYLAAHNSTFDRSVLKACCQAYNLSIPEIPFLCTCSLSKKTLGLDCNKLDVVCGHLNIELKHHDAMSDAEAAARIVLHARKTHPEALAEALNGCKVVLS